MRTVSVIMSVGALILLTGCSQMSNEEKYDHLRDVANKGADAHFVLINENKDPNQDVCSQHYKVFVPDGAPAEQGFWGGRNSKEWNDLSLDYFVDSCVKGEPRVIQTRSSQAPPPPPPSATPAPSATSAGAP